MVPGDASYVTKSEFNAALALLALSQKNVGKSPVFHDSKHIICFSLMPMILTVIPDVSVHSLSRHRNGTKVAFTY